MLKNSGLPKARYRPGTHALDTVPGIADNLAPGCFFLSVNDRNKSKLYQVLDVSKSKQVFVVVQQYNCSYYPKEVRKFSPTDKVRMYDPWPAT